jgi:Na+-translocating ferredoxin:NAD+ oxidoreductase subunit G
MKKNNDMLKSALVLGIVCIISASILGIVYGFTYDLIQKREIENLNNNMKDIFPDAEEFIELKHDEFQAISYGEIIGIIRMVETQGYGGNIKMLIGVHNEKIIGLRIVEHSETPGLGANIINDYFYEQFNELEINKLKLKKDGGEIDAITGATISTQAVIKGAKESLKNNDVNIYKNNNVDENNNVESNDNELMNAYNYENNDNVESNDNELMNVYNN